MTQNTFTRTKALIVPQLKMVDDEPIFVKVESPIYLGKELKGKDGKLTQADIMNVINLETGEEMQLLIGTIAKEVLNETFKDKGYVGKCFEMTRHPKASGKAYKTYSLFEISVDTQPVAVDGTTTKTK